MNENEENKTESESPQEGTAGEPNAVLQAERDQLFERLARVSADYQNYQRRMEQSLGDSVRLASGDLLKQFVSVIDHFDTALSREPQTEDAKAIHEGVRIVRDELMKVLQKAGVERVEVAVGDAFDPHRHEAMLHRPAQGVAPNHVTMAMQPGYLYKGRTLRPAKVAVAPEE